MSQYFVPTWEAIENIEEMWFNIQLRIVFCLKSIHLEMMFKGIMCLIIKSTMLTGVVSELENNFNVQKCVIKTSIKLLFVSPY